MWWLYLIIAVGLVILVLLFIWLYKILVELGTITPRKKKEKNDENNEIN